MVISSLPTLKLFLVAFCSVGFLHFFDTPIRGWMGAKSFEFPFVTLLCGL